MNSVLLDAPNWPRQTVGTRKYLGLFTLLCTIPTFVRKVFRAQFKALQMRILDILNAPRYPY